MSFRRWLRTLFAKTRSIRNAKSRPRPHLETLESRLAPAGDFGFAVQFGAAGSSAQGNAIATDSAGNTYVAGQFSNQADFTKAVGSISLTSAGSSDAFVAKFDSTGKAIWAVGLGASGNDAAFGVVADGSGSVFVTGSFSGSNFASAGINASGASDIFLAKVDANSGSLQWAKQYGGAGVDAGKGIALDAAGKIYLVGSFFDRANFGGSDLFLSENGTKEAFVVRLKSDGTFDGAQAAFGSSTSQEDIARQVRVDSSGNVFLVGAFGGQVDFDPSVGTQNRTAAGRDGFVLKLTSAFAYSWVTAFGGAGLDEVAGIALDGSGVPFVVGTTNGGVDDPPANSDAFVAKLNPANGSSAWTFGLNSDDLDLGSGISADASGNVFATGTFRGLGFPSVAGTLTAAGNDDAFVVGLAAADGTLQWSRQLGAPSSAARGAAIATDASGGVVTTGRFASTADFDPGTGTANRTAVGSQDGFLSRLSTTASVSFVDNGTNRTLTLPSSGSYRLVRNGSNVEVYQGARLLTSTSIGTTPFVFNGTTGNDSFVIDLSGGNLAVPITFNGGSQTSTPGDSLTITGGSFATGTFAFTNANDGTISLPGNGLITYTGLEPIVTTGTTINDLILTFNGGAETIALTDGTAGDGFMTIDSDLSESLTFANPSGSLTINAGTGADVVNITSVDAGFHASLTINGEAASDTVNLNADITFAAGKSLIVNAESVTTGPNADLTTSGAGTITLTADDVALDASSTLVSAGTVTFAPQTATRPIDLGTNTPGSLSLTDAELDRVTAATTQIGDANSGAVTVSSAITHANNLSLTTGAGISGNVPLTLAATKNLNITSNGAVSLTGGVDVPGTTTVAAGSTNDIALVGGNNLGKIVITSGKNVALTYPGGTTLGASTISGTLNVLVANGPINQAGAVTVAGLATLTTQTAGFDINLSTQVNDFSTVAVSSASNAFLTDGNSLILAASSVNSGSGDLQIAFGGATTGSLTQTGVLGGNRLIVAGGGAFTTGTTTLNTSANSFNAASFQTNGNVSYQDANAITVYNTQVSGAGSLSVTAAGNITSGGTFVTAAGTTTLNAGSADITWGGNNNFDANILNVTGNNITLNDESGGFVLSGAAVGNLLTFNSGDTITQSGAITGNGRIAQQGLFGSGTLILSQANTYLGSTTILSGTTIALSAASANTIANSATIDVQSGGSLNVTGLTGGTLTLASGQTLKGNGTVTGKTIAANGSTIDPGASPGILNTGNFTFDSGSGFNVEINGTAGAGAASGHDQVNVAGAVVVNDANLVVALGYVPANGDSFVIVNNDLSDAVTVTAPFKVGGVPIPEGGAFVVGGNRFVITYAGGTNNNDVVLTVQNFTSQVALVSGDLVVSDVAGGGQNDSLTIKSNTATGKFEISDPNRILGISGAIAGATVSGDLHTIFVPFTSVPGKILVNTLTGNDSLTIDLSGGMLPDITFDGGAGGNDTLTVIGNGSTNAKYSPASSSTASNKQGTVQIAGSGTTNISFSNLEPVNITGMSTASLTSVSLTPLVAGNSFTIANGTQSGNAGQAAIVVSGTTNNGATSIETVHFYNNTTVQIDTSSIASSTDTFTISGANGTAAGITNLTFSTGSEAGDSIAINGAVTVGGTLSLITGGAATQSAAISAPTLVLGAAGNAGSYTLTNSSNTIGTLTATTTANANVTDSAGGLALAGGNVGGTFTLTTTGGLSQTSSVAAGVLSAGNSGTGNIALDSFANSINSFSATNNAAGGAANIQFATAGTVTGITTSNGSVNISNAAGSVLALAGNITTGGGSVTFASNTASVDLSAAGVSITTGGGAMTVSRPVNADNPANNRTLNVTAGAGSVSLGSVGVTRNLQALTIVSSGTGSSVGAITTGSGGISIASSGMTLNGNLSSDALATAGAISFFGPFTLGVGITIDSDSSTTDAGITFATGTTVTGANALTLNAGTANVALNNTSLGTPTAISSLNITAGDVNGSGSIAASGTISIAITGAASTLSGSITNGSLIKSGTGTLTLSGTNTYNGGTIVSQGTLQVDVAAGASSGLVTLNDANTGANNTAFLATGAFTVANNIVIANQGTGISTIGTTNFASASATFYSGTVTLNKAATLQNGNADRTSYSGQITGSGAITLMGFGASGTNTNRATFDSNSNNFTGNIGITGANTKLQLNNTNTIPDAVSIDVGTGAFLYFNTASETIDGLTGSGTVQKHPGVGGLTTFTIGANNTTSTFSGVIADGGGQVAITKAGTGTQTLNGASTFTGAVVVNAGTVRIGNKNALGANNTAFAKVTVASGATVDFNGTADAVYGYTISGAGVGGSGALVNTGSAIGTGIAQTSNIRLAADATIGGTGDWALLTSGYGATTLDLAGFTLTKAGGNAFTLANATVTAGSLQINGGSVTQIANNKPAGHDLSTVAVTLANTSGVALNLNNLNLSVGSLAGGGTTGGNTNLGSGRLTVGNLGTTTSYAGAIAGTGGLSKVGAGTLTLSGNNSFTGSVAANVGTIKVGNAHAFGAYDTTVTKVVVASGATVDLNGTIDPVFGYTIAGTGVGGAGAIVNTGVGISMSTAQTSNIKLAADASIGGSGDMALLTFGYAATTLDLNGFKLTKSGTNTFTLANAVITAGSLQIGGGVVTQIANNKPAGHDLSNVAVTLANTAGVVLNLNNLNLSIGSLSGGGVTGGNVGLGSGTLTVGNLGTSTSHAGIISGTGGVTKIGSGTLTLAGTNVYNGPTNVNVGTLLVNGTLASNVAVSNGATLGGSGSIAGTVTISAGGFMAPGNSPGVLNTGNYSQAGALNAEIVNPNGPTVVAGTDADQVNVTGTVNLTGALNLNFIGSGAIPNGTVYTLINNDAADVVTGAFAGFANGSAFNANSQPFVIFYNGGTGNDVTLTTVPQLVPTTAYVSGTWSNLTNGSVIGDADFGTTGSQQGIFGYNAFTTLAAAQAAIGAGGVIIVNAGTYAETITLANTQSVEITGPDSAQSVVINSLTTASGQNLTIEGASNLTLGDATNSSLAGLIQGSGSLTKQGTGTLTLSGANTFSGGTTLSQGTLTTSASAAVGSGILTMNGGTLNTSVNLSNNIILNNTTNTFAPNGFYRVLSGQIGGAGGFILADGGGTPGLELNNPANNFAGSVTINANTYLRLSASEVLPNTASVINNGNLRLDVAGGGSETIDGLSGTGSIWVPTTNSNSHTLIVGASNATSTYNGTVGASGQNNAFLALTKIGAGTLTLANTVANSYTGLTTVNAGILAIAGTVTDGTILGNVVVNSGGTLRLDAANRIANTSLTTLNGTGTLNTNGQSDAVGALAGNGVINGGGSLTLDMLAGTQQTFSGTITNTSIVGRGENDNGTSSKQIFTGTWTGGSLGVARGNSANDVVVIELAGSGATNISSVSVGQSGSGTATLNIGGTHALTDTGTFYVGEQPGQPGVVNQTGGTVTVAGQIRLGHWPSETSTYNLSGGALNSNGGLYVGWDGTGSMTASGSGSVNATAGIIVQQNSTLTLSGSASIVTNSASVGDSRGAGSVVQNGGSMTINGELRLGHFATTGAYTVNSGTLTVNGTGTAAESAGVITIGVDGTGTLNQNGGTITTRGLYLDSRAATSGTDQYNLTAGTLVLTSSLGVAGNATSSTYQVTLAGGTVQSNASWTSSSPITLGGAPTNAAFNTNGNSVVLNGVLSGSLGLDKSGAGSVTLGGANTYTGITNVNAGSLFVNGSLANGAAADDVVVAGGVLGGTGTISGAVRVDSGSLAPGLSPGILNVGGATFTGGSFAVEIAGATVGTQYDQLNVTGSVALGAGVATLNLSGSFAPLLGNSFVLINNDGTDNTTGYFAGMPEGAAITFNGVPLYLTYNGGDGNDVVLNTTPIMSGTAGADTFVFRQINGSPGQFELSLNGGPFANLGAITSATINGLDGNDTLTIDYSNGAAIPIGGLTFNGNSQTSSPGDKLIVQGGIFANFVSTYTNANDGSISFDGRVVAYTGLEPILVNAGSIANAVFNLPGPATVATLGDDGTLANGLIRLSSSPATFEDTIFTAPTGSLTVNRGNAADTLALGNLSDFVASASLTLGTSGAAFANISFGGTLTASALAAFGTTMSNTASANVDIANNSSFSGTTIALGTIGGDDFNFGSLTVASGGSVTVAEDSATKLVGANSSNSLSLTSAGALINDSTASLAVANNASFGGTSIALGSVGGLFDFGSLTFGSAGSVDITEDSSTSLVGASTATSLTLTSAGAQTNAATSSLLVTNNAAFQGTSIDLGNAAGDTVNFGAVAATATSSLIAITEDSATAVNTLSAVTTVTLQSAGAITDNNAGAVNVNGTTFIVSAVGGIDLDTTVADLTAATSAAGSILIDESDAITLTSVTASDGSITIAAGAAITATSVVSSTDADANDISLTAATGDVSLISVNAGATAGDATIQATAGSIVDVGNDLVIDVTGDFVTLTASGDIGQIGTQHIDTRANSLTTSSNSSVVAGTHGTWINEFDAVTLTSAATTDGVILVDAAGTMTVTTVNAGGTGRNIRLRTSAGDIAFGTAGSVTAAGNSVAIQAAGAVTESTSATKVTAGQVVIAAAMGIGASGDLLDVAVSSIAARSNTGGVFIANSSGPLTIASLTILTVSATGVSTTTSGNIAVTNATGDVILDQAVTTPNDASITASAGTIVDLASDSVTDISANALTLSAATGIGTGAGGSIDTTVGSVTASVTAAGSIDLNETDSITLTSVTTADGSITVIAGGTVTATSVISSTDATNVIAITTTAGDILVDSVSAVGDTITLNAAAAIEEVAAGDAGSDLTASVINLTAATGIGSLATIEIDGNTVANRGLTASVTGTGPIRLLDVNGLRVRSATTANGDIILSAAGGDLTLETVTAGSVGSTANLSANGAILDGNGPALNITATNLTLKATTGIGAGTGTTFTDELETVVTNADLSNTASGGIYLRNAGALTLKDLDAVADGLGVVSVGGGRVEATSPITVSSNQTIGASMTFVAGNSASPTDTITFDSNAVVTFNAGAGATLRYEAGDSILFNTGSIATTGTATVQLLADQEAGGFADGLRGVVTQTGSINSVASTSGTVDLQIVGVEVGTSNVVPFRFEADTLQADTTAGDGTANRTRNQWLQEADTVTVNALTGGGLNAGAGQVAPLRGHVFLDGGTFVLAAGDGINDQSAVRMIGSAVLDLNNDAETIGSLSSPSGTTASVVFGTGALTTGVNNLSTTWNSGTVGGGSGGLVKTGSGSFRLAAGGTYTFTGAIDDNAGALVVNGSLASSSNAITVAAGAILGGTGTLNRPLVVQGTLSPGDSGAEVADPTTVPAASLPGPVIGVLNTGTGSTVQFAATATYLVDMTLGFPTVPGTQFDQLKTDAAITIVGGATLNINTPIAPSQAANVGTSFRIIDNGAGSAISGKFAVPIDQTPSLPHPEIDPVKRIVVGGVYYEELYNAEDGQPIPLASPGANDLTLRIDQNNVSVITTQVVSYGPVLEDGLGFTIVLSAKDTETANGSLTFFIDTLPNAGMLYFDDPSTPAADPRPLCDTGAFTGSQLGTAVVGGVNVATLTLTYVPGGNVNPIPSPSYLDTFAYTVRDAGGLNGDAARSASAAINVTLTPSNIPDNALFIRSEPTGNVLFVTGSGSSDIIKATGGGATFTITRSAYTYVITDQGGGSFQLSTKLGAGKPVLSILSGGAGPISEVRMFGRAGADTLDGSALAVRTSLFGGAGNDILKGGSLIDVLFGGSEVDNLYGSTGDDAMFGGAGNDTLWGDADNDCMHGGEGSDTLWGGPGNDELEGAAGVDYLYGEAGNDIIDGGSENDVLRGGDGDDVLNGGPGIDSIYGGIGNDTFQGFGNEAESDTFAGEGGIETLEAIAGAPLVLSQFLPANGITIVRGNGMEIWGGAGRNTLDFSAVTNMIAVAAIDGRDGDDVITGNDQPNVIRGGAGNDYLYGRGGNDVLIGDAGVDVLDGGAGDDTLWGGSIGTPDVSADYFSYTSASLPGSDADDIRDFTDGVDRIDLRPYSPSTSLTLQKPAVLPGAPSAGIVYAVTDTATPADLILLLPNGKKIRIRNVAIANLTQADFLNVL